MENSEVNKTKEESKSEEEEEEEEIGEVVFVELGGIVRGRVEIVLVLGGERRD